MGDFYFSLCEATERCHPERRRREGPAFPQVRRTCGTSWPRIMHLGGCLPPLGSARILLVPLNGDTLCAHATPSPSSSSPPSVATPHRHPTPRPRPNRRSTPPTQIGLGSPPPATPIHSRSCITRTVCCCRPTWRPCTAARRSV